MISLKLWNKNLKISDQVKYLLKESFNNENFNLIKNKTYVICIFKNKKIVATVSLLDNFDLMQFINSKPNMINFIDNFLFRASKGIFIYNLAVRKKYRKMGFAKKIVEILLYFCRLKKYSYCHVQCENKASEAIFKKYGFCTEKVFKIKSKNLKLMSHWL